MHSCYKIEVLRAEIGEEADEPLCTFFIQVRRLPSTAKWTARQTYTDFWRLHSQLEQMFGGDTLPPLPLFPVDFPTSAITISHLESEVEDYLSDVVAYINPLPAVLRQFLGLAPQIEDTVDAIRIDEEDLLEDDNGVILSAQSGNSFLEGEGGEWNYFSEEDDFSEELASLLQDDSDASLFSEEYLFPSSDKMAQVPYAEEESLEVPHNARRVVKLLSQLQSEPKNKVASLREFQQWFISHKPDLSEDSVILLLFGTVKLNNGLLCEIGMPGNSSLVTTVALGVLQSLLSAEFSLISNRVAQILSRADVYLRNLNLPKFLHLNFGSVKSDVFSVLDAMSSYLQSSQIASILGDMKAYEDFLTWRDIHKSFNRCRYLHPLVGNGDLSGDTTDTFVSTNPSPNTNQFPCYSSIISAGFTELQTSLATLPMDAVLASCPKTQTRARMMTNSTSAIVTPLGRISSDISRWSSYFNVASHSTPPHHNTSVLPKNPRTPAPSTSQHPIRPDSSVQSSLGSFSLSPLPLHSGGATSRDRVTLAATTPEKMQKGRTTSDLDQWSVGVSLRREKFGRTKIADGSEEFGLLGGRGSGGHRHPRRGTESDATLESFLWNGPSTLMNMSSSSAVQLYDSQRRRTLFSSSKLMQESLRDRGESTSRPRGPSVSKTSQRFFSGGLSNEGHPSLDSPGASPCHSQQQGWRLVTIPATISQLGVETYGGYQSMGFNEPGDGAGGINSINSPTSSSVQNRWYIIRQQCIFPAPLEIVVCAFLAPGKFLEVVLSHCDSQMTHEEVHLVRKASARGHWSPRVCKVKVLEQLGRHSSVMSVEVESTCVQKPARACVLRSCRYVSAEKSFYFVNTTTVHPDFSYTAPQTSSFPSGRDRVLTFRVLGYRMSPALQPATACVIDTYGMIPFRSIGLMSSDFLGEPTAQRYEVVPLVRLAQLAASNSDCVDAIAHIIKPLYAYIPAGYSYDI